MNLENDRNDPDGAIDRDDAEELTGRVRGLPRSIEPGRDLWPGVEARIRAISPIKGHIEPEGTHAEACRTGRGERKPDRRSGPFDRPSVGRRPWLLGLAAAAGFTGIIAASLLFEGGADGGAGGPAVGPPSPTGAAPYVTQATAREQIEAVESAYERDLSVLKALVESSELAPETREVLDESLATIERAMDEAREALEADPGANRAVERLRRMYDAKVDMLRLVATQPSRT